MMNLNNHPFHMVDYSPWPIKSTMLSLCMMMTFIELMYLKNYINLIIIMMLLVFTMMKWWWDISREATLQGLHSIKSINNLKLGMMLFIISEVMFFFSFFWMYLNSSISINIELGLNWPPSNINPFNPYFTPLLNTIILLTSGLTVTMAHLHIINKNHKKTYNYLLMTIILGIYFSALQMLEYKQASFSISDSSFGSAFFISTGFHGIHVMIGSMFLLITLLRLNKNNLSKSHHLGLELASWYWHFVDVVWLLLYTLMYYWYY